MKKVRSLSDDPVRFSRALKNIHQDLNEARLLVEDEPSLLGLPVPIIVNYYKSDLKVETIGFLVSNI